MKISIIAALIMLLTFMVSCNGSYDEPTCERDSEKHASEAVSVVYIANGEIIPNTRAERCFGASAALSFRDEKALAHYRDILADMSEQNKEEMALSVGVMSLSRLEDLAAEELDLIGAEATSESEFRQMYSEYVEKYCDVLIPNYVDESDLNLYAPTDSPLQIAYIANENGEYVVGNKVVKADVRVLPQSVQILSSIGSRTASNAATYVNEYEITPKKNKRVKFAIKRIDCDIKVCMTVKKKMWYGWTTDPNRDLFFEVFLNNFTFTKLAPLRKLDNKDRYVYVFFQTKHVDEVIGYGNPITVPMAYPPTVTGTVYTWTDMDLEVLGDLQQPDDSQIKPGLPDLFPRSLSKVVKVNLPYTK